MPAGPLGGKGLPELIQPLVTFPILMRVILPGGLAMAGLYPLTGVEIDWLSGDFLTQWRELVLVAGGIFLLGTVISTLNGQIYKIYEGRILWPEGLFDGWKKRQQKRIDGLKQKADKAHQEGKMPQYNECWYRLRVYPLNDKGDPEATHPTLIGNLLAAYEDYPNSRYGMDSVFYWPRLWLQVDKDKKEEIDGAWSVADGFLSLSAVSYLLGVGWIAAALINVVMPGVLHPVRDSAGTTALLGVGWLASGYVFYRWSLPFHERNGETFKALFDLYRDKVTAMTRVGPREKETWEGTWTYLQYLGVKCRECKEYYPAHKDQCPHCGHSTAQSLMALKREEEGKVPRDGMNDGKNWLSTLIQEAGKFLQRRLNG